MKTLTNRNFVPRLVDMIYEIREDYREAYNKTNLEYICEELAEEIRSSLSYNISGDYYFANLYLDKIEELQDEIRAELDRLHEDFMERYQDIIDSNCLFDMMSYLKDPNGNLLFNFDDEDFDLYGELDEIMSNPNNLAYELVKDKLDEYFYEVYLEDEAGEWGEAHDYDNMRWAEDILLDYVNLLSPEEREFMKKMREGGDK